MSGKHTPGTWKRGKAGGSIVSDRGDGIHPGDDPVYAESVEYYGGHVIAESVAPCNQPIILAAPDLLEALEALLPFLTDCRHPVEDGPQETRHCAKCDALRLRAEIIAKAKGE